MKIMLDPDSGYLKKNKKEYDKKSALVDAGIDNIIEEVKFDKNKALKNTGVKAAVCFRDGEITPEMIRATETEEQLIKRGLNTIKSDHTSPSEQQSVSLEITNIPKILCMILNNEHQYAADERSLRYTEVKPSEYISHEETTLYNKWLNIFIKILNDEYYEFFWKFNQGETEEKTKKKVASAIKKIAQENARYMVSVFIPTTLTYTVPFAQINKICLYMERIIANPLNEFEELIVPYLKEFIQGIKDLDILVTEHDAHVLVPSLKVPDTDNLLYKNNKNIDLSLFAERNEFSGINLPNEYGVSISYNMAISFASLAQFHRHRTVNFEMSTPKITDTRFYIPLLLDNKPALQKEWLKDINTVNKYYPQGKILDVNANGPLKHFVNYVGKERACDRAFLETEDMFTNEMLPNIYDGLIKNGKMELASNLEPYVGKLRCMYPSYNCPGKCGHPRVRRKF